MKRRILTRPCCLITGGICLITIITLFRRHQIEEFILEPGSVNVVSESYDPSNVARKLMVAPDTGTHQIGGVIPGNQTLSGDSDRNKMLVHSVIPDSDVARELAARASGNNVTHGASRKYITHHNVTQDALRNHAVHAQKNSSRAVSNSSENASKDKAARKIKRLPTALIVGEPKAGTGALMSFLSQHPGVAMPDAEINFFDRQAYNRGLDWYKEKMVPSYPWQITMEKSPYYYTSGTAVSRINKLNPKMKILVACSDPIHRAVSHYVHMSLSYSLPGKQPQMYRNFSEMVIAKTGRVNSGVGEIRHSSYVTSLNTWFKLFPREQMLFVDGSAISKEPWAEFQKVEEFLGLKPFLTKERFVMNKERGFYCLRLDSGEDFCLPGWKGRKHPEVEQWVIDRLKAHFKPLNEQFFKKIGHRMSWADNYT